MQFYKRVLAIAAVAFMAVFAVYSSQMDEEASALPSTVGTPKETIYFWYTDDTLTSYISSAAVAFGNKKDVHVIPVLKGDGEFLEAVSEATVIDKQSVPDAYVLSNDSLEKAYLAGLANPVLDDSKILTKDYFPQTALNAVTYKNQYVAYPFFYETSVLVYNRDYLDQWLEQQKQKALEVQEEPEDEGEEGDSQAEELVEGESEETAEEVEEVDAVPMEQQITADGIPLTMDGLLHIADTFDVPETVEGIMEWDVSDIFYNYWFVGAYLEVGGEFGDQAEIRNINNEQTAKCLAMYQSLNQFFSIESDQVTYDACIQDFMDGKTVFTLGSTELVRLLEEQKREGNIGFKYGFCMIPSIRPSLESKTLSVTNAVAINGYSEHKLLANEFATYLTDDYAKELYARTGKVSANKTVPMEDGFVLTFMKAYENSVSLPKLMEIGNFWLQLERLFLKVWNGEEIAPLLEELQSQIDSQLIRK